MDANFLGPLDVTESGTTIVPNASKPRQILSLLALRADRVVQSTTLVEEIWGTRPPPSAINTMQTYIMQLRRHISVALAGTPNDRTAHNVLATTYGGYCMHSDNGRSDVSIFEGCAASGQLAEEKGDLRTASRLYDEALSLWRGPALVDVPAGDVLSLEVQFLSESRLSVHERRIGVDLALGRSGQVLSELHLLTMQYPMNENLVALLMTAFQNCGQSWRALESYKRLRDIMISDLGIEPSTRLKRLHHAVLAGEDCIISLPSGGARRAVSA